MKNGVIVIEFEGGNKRKDNPDYNRAITLSSFTQTFLENILSTRIELFDAINPPIQPLQGGFRKHQDCLMTEFSLKRRYSLLKKAEKYMHVPWCKEDLWSSITWWVIPQVI